MDFIKEKLIDKNRISLLILATILFWAKTMMAYYTEFSLGVTGPLQTFILWINPFATTIVFLSIALYVKDEKKSNYTLLFIYFLLSVLLYANIVYYREFADFMTLSTIQSNLTIDEGTNISFGLIGNFLVMLRIQDILYWVDFLLLAWIVRKRKMAREELSGVEEPKEPFHKRYALAGTLSGIALLFANLMIAEIDRPQLLARTFDRNYIVKYLGVNFYTGYDAIQTVRNNQLRAQADESDLEEVQKFANENYAVPNEELFGLAEGRNVFYIALESFQQFLIDFDYEDEEGNVYEPTPFLNSLYHDESTISFNNFFHQTGQGKSSDSEVLAENSLYGLPEGSAFQVLGGDNVFHATPKILGEELGYTSAAFHGNTGTFWNRNDTYQQFGYDYFFDSHYYDLGDGRTQDYGLKDKLFFRDSVEYIEQLPQPFYTKFITLTNHFPYPLDEEDVSIPKATTDDNTVNSYFQTVRYTDEALEEFFNWTKEVGLYENSIFILYGDHFGNSNMRNPSLAPLLDEDPEEWDAYDNAQMQRVPLIYHIPGYTDGKTYETYGGQVDMLPTLLHLLGVEGDSYLMMGQDLLSPENEQVVTLRNGNVLMPDYHYIGSDVYDAKTGENLTETLTEEELEVIEERVEHAHEKLTNSDNILTLDLLRFYQPKTLRSWEPVDYIYTQQMGNLRAEPNLDTNLISELGVDTTIDLYESDAAQLPGNEPKNIDEDDDSSVDGEDSEEPTNIEE